MAIDYQHPPGGLLRPLPQGNDMANTAVLVNPATLQAWAEALRIAAAKIVIAETRSEVVAVATQIEATIPTS